MNETVNKREMIYRKKKKKKYIEVRFYVSPKVRAIKDKAWIQPEMEHVALDSTRVCIILSGPTYSDSFWKPSILLVPLFPLFLSLENPPAYHAHPNVRIRIQCVARISQLSQAKSPEKQTIFQLLFLIEEFTNVIILSIIKNN